MRTRWLEQKALKHSDNIEKGKKIKWKNVFDIRIDIDLINSIPMWSCVSERCGHENWTTCSMISKGSEIPMISQFNRYGRIGLSKTWYSNIRLTTIESILSQAAQMKWWNILLISKKHLGQIREIQSNSQLIFSGDIHCKSVLLFVVEI